MTQDELLALLESLRRNHDECEDCWYSCPKSGQCCNDAEPADRCNCGADQYNEKLDRAIAGTRSLIAMRRAGDTE